MCDRCGGFLDNCWSRHWTTSSVLTQQVRWARKQQRAETLRRSHCKERHVARCCSWSTLTRSPSKGYLLIPPMLSSPFQLRTRLQPTTIHVPKFKFTFTRCQTPTACDGCAPNSVAIVSRVCLIVKSNQEDGDDSFSCDDVIQR